MDMMGKLDTLALNWKGRVRVVEQCFEDARTLVRSIGPLADLPFDVEMANDDEICLWLEVDGGYFNMGVYGNGRYSYFCRLRSGVTFQRDGIPVYKWNPENEMKEWFENAVKKDG